MRRIFFSGISGLASKGVNLLATLFTIYIVNQYYSDEKFSIYLIIISLLGMLGFADLGLGYGLFNQISKDNNDEAKLKKSISTAFIFLSGIGFLFLLIGLCLIIYNPDVNLFNSSVESVVNESNLAGYVFILIFAVSLPFTLIRKVQGAFQEAYKGDIWDIFGNILGIIAFLVFINESRGLVFLVIVMIGLKNIAIIVNFFVFFYKEKPNLLPSFLFFDKQKLKSIMGDGFLFFFLQIMAVILNSGDTYMISKFFGTKDAADYAIGYRVFTFYFVPIVAVIAPFLAANNNALAEKDYTWLKNSFKKSLKVVTLISVACFLIYVFTTNTFITLWLGEDKTLSLSYLLGFGAFIVYSNLNAVYSQMMMSYVFLRKYIVIYTITGVSVFIIKLLICEYGKPEYFLWATTITSFLLYFLPAHILLWNSSFGEKYKLTTENNNQS